VIQSIEMYLDVSSEGTEEPNILGNEPAQHTPVRVPPGSPALQEFLEFAHREGLRDWEIADTAWISEGVCRGLYWFDKAERKIQFDEGWPHGEVQQEKLFSIKKASDSIVREEMLVRHFSLARAGSIFATEEDDPKAKSTRVCAFFVRTSAGAAPREEGSDTPSTKTYIQTTYFTPDALQRFIRSLHGDISGLLTLYVPPKSQHHNVVRVLYTPFVIKMEKHRTKAVLTDRSATMGERTATQGDAVEVVDVSPALRSTIAGLCRLLAGKCRSLGSELRQANYYFLDGNDEETLPGQGAQRGASPVAEESADVSRVQFLWCSSIETKEISGLQHRPASGKAGRTDTSKVGAAPGPSAGPKIRAPLWWEEGAAICPPTPPPSPVPEALMTDQVIQMFDGIQHYGFWGDEERRVKNSLKRQIQTLSFVKDPSSFELQDILPYKMDFIQALIDPKKGERYFAKQLALERRMSRRGTRVQMERSMSISAASVSMFGHSWTMHSRSGSSSPKHTDGHRSGYHSPLASPNTLQRSNSDAQSLSLIPMSSSHAPPSPSGSMSNSRIHISGDAPEGEGTGEVEPDANLERPEPSVEKVELPNHDPIVEAPDDYHDGRILHLRAKYRSAALLELEAQSHFQKFQRQQAVKKAALRTVQSALRRTPLIALNESDEGKSPSQTSQVSAGSRRPSSGASSILKEKRPGSAHPISPTRARSKSDMRRGRQRSPSKSVGRSGDTTGSEGSGWVDVTHIDYSKKEHKVPIRGTNKGEDLAPHPSAGLGGIRKFLRKEIPHYERMLRDRSLQNYLVGAETFEKPEPEKHLRIPPEELKRLTKRKADLANSSLHVPDPPVVMMGNTHLSVTEEILAARRREGRVKRDLLQTLFDDELERQRELEEERHRLASAEREERRRAEELRRHMEHQRRQSELQQHNESLAQELQYRKTMQTQYAARQTKEKVQTICFAFEDLLYSQTSKRLQRRSEDHNSVVAGQPGQWIVLAIPAQHYEISADLHALLVGAGFTVRPISAELLAEAEEQLRQDNMLNDDDYYRGADELTNRETLPHREYVLHNDPATLSRAKAEAQNYLKAVLQMYQEERWEDVDRVNTIMATQGYAHYDAVTSILRNNSKQVGRTIGSPN
jgi:hypothetical protein